MIPVVAQAKTASVEGCHMTSGLPSFSLLQLVLASLNFDFKDSFELDEATLVGQGPWGTT